MRAEDDSNRGEGNLSGAMQRRSRSGGRGAARPPEESGNEFQREGIVRGDGSPRRQRRRRSKTGKRSEPNYTLTGALVRRDRYDRVKHLLSDPEIRDEVIGELDEWDVWHQPGKASYSDLVEMLLLQWMDSYEAQG